uniref:MHC class I-like antigen recognition-like domain-containing protein n=1 Tax=Naja naja TaxID=35670 RepID=A0A8C6Y5X0_NAJNA
MTTKPHPQIRPRPQNRLLRNLNPTPLLNEFLPIWIPSRHLFAFHEVFLHLHLDPNQGQPHHVAVGFVDGQVFLHYDSHSRKMEPRVSWMEKVGKEDPNYWVRNTQMARDTEEASRGDLETLSGGIQKFFTTSSLRADGSRGGFDQYGYDGRTFLTFDKETLTWVAPDPQAQITKRKWDTSPVYNRRGKAYLEEICIKWLEKHLSYGKETLLKRGDTGEHQGVTVVRGKTEVEDGMETHARLDGFYPREIDASWTRDGEVWEEETFHGEGRYRCHVEHGGLQEPLDLALEDLHLSHCIVLHTPRCSVCLWVFHPWGGPASALNINPSISPPSSQS